MPIRYKLYQKKSVLNHGRTSRTQVNGHYVAKNPWPFIKYPHICNTATLSQYLLRQLVFMREVTIKLEKEEGNEAEANIIKE